MSDASEKRLGNLQSLKAHTGPKVIQRAVSSWLFGTRYLDWVSKNVLKRTEYICLKTQEHSFTQ